MVPAMAHIIAISNQKGGVGKTTTAINLAASLSAAEQKTLLVDLDPQGNATSGIGIDKHSLMASTYEVLVEQCDVQTVICKTPIPYLDVIPSNTELVGAEIQLVAAVSRETRLKEALAPVQDLYDYIIIDCPPSLGLLTLNAMTASTQVVIPMQCEYLAMEGMADLYQTIQLVKGRLNPDLRIAGIALTMVDPRNNLTHQVIEELKSHFKDLVFTTLIPRNVRLSEAPSHGKPIILYDIKSKGALRYMELTQELMDRLATPTLRAEQEGEVLVPLLEDVPRTEGDYNVTP